MGYVRAATVSSASVHLDLRRSALAEPWCLNAGRSAVFFDSRRWSSSPSMTGTTVLVPSIVDTEAAAESAPPTLLLALGALDPSLGEHAWNATIPLHTRLVRPSRGSASYLSIALPPPQVFLYCRGRQHVATGQPSDDRSVCPPLSWIGSEWRAACAQVEVRAAAAAPTAGKWVRVPPGLLGPTQTTSVQLPVGTVDDAAWVGVVTASAVAAVAIAFGFTVVKESGAYQRSSKRTSTWRASV